MTDLDDPMGQLLRSVEYHRGVACMVSADLVLELFARLHAAEAECERLRAVVDAGVERHSRFHPNLWAVERNCSECIVLAALATPPDPKEPT